jgi:hypothetical protein
MDLTGSNYSFWQEAGWELRAVVPKLEEQRGLRVKKSVREKLLRVSAATADRLLRPERKKVEIKSRARTRPGTLLKHQVPVRTYSGWDQRKAGFLKIDLGGHDGRQS